MFGFGFRYALGAYLVGGGTEIFNANVALFNGTTDYKEAPATLASALQIGLQSFSKSIWIKTTQSTTGMIMNSSINGTGDRFDFYNAGQGDFSFRVEDEAIRVTGVFDGSWHFITIAKDNDTGKSQGGFTGELSISIDGDKKVPSYIERYVNLESVSAGTSNPLTYGRRSYTNSLHYQGEMSNGDFHVGTVVSEADALAQYNLGQQTCFDLYDANYKASITEHWSLGEWVGNTGNAFIGSLGVQDLTAGTLPLTGSAQIECEA